MLSRFREWFYNSLLSFNERDLASGGWFLRVGRPVIVMYFAVYTFYFVVTGTGMIPANQLGGIVVFYITIQLILGILLFAIVVKVYSNPIIEVI